jgi:hypothetical protein
MISNCALKIKSFLGSKNIAEILHTNKSFFKNKTYYKNTENMVKTSPIFQVRYVFYCSVFKLIKLLYILNINLKLYILFLTSIGLQHLR